MFPRLSPLPLLVVALVVTSVTLAANSVPARSLAELPTYESLYKGRQFHASAKLAAQRYVSSASKREAKKWAKRFKKARKLAIKGALKEGKAAFKRKDFKETLRAASLADAAAAETLPRLATAKPKPAKKRKKRKKLAGDKLRKAVTKRLMKPVKAATKRGDFVGAYAATAPIVAFFGDDPATESVVGSVRTAVYRAADNHTNRGEFAQAHQLLSLVAKTEPRRAAEVSGRKAVVTGEEQLRSGSHKAAMNTAQGAMKAATLDAVRNGLGRIFNRAKGLAVSKEMTHARQALAKAQFQEAVNRSRAADQLSRRFIGTPPKPDSQATGPGTTIRVQAHGALMGPPKAALARGDYGSAYAGLDPLFRVFPQDADGRALRGAIRGKIYGESNALMANNRFKAARKILAIVVRYEPQRRAEVDRRKQGIKVAKAESFDRSAADAEAKGDDLGAWALARRSLSMGFAPARDRARRIRRRLRQSGQFAVRLDMYGDAGRAKKHRAGVERVLGKVPGIARGKRQHGRPLTVAVNVPWPRCFQTQQEFLKNFNYMTYRQVPNPQWDTAKRRQASVAGRWQTSNKQLTKARRNAKAALGQLTRCASDEGKAKGWIRRANRTLKDETGRLNRTKKMLVGARKRLTKAEADHKKGKKGAGSILLVTRMEVGRLQQQEIKDGNRVHKAKGQAKNAKIAVDKATRSCNSIRTHQRSTESRRSSAVSNFTRVDGELRRANKVVSRTPKFNKVGTKHSAPVRVARVRRTCPVTADVTVRGRRGKGKTQRLDHPRFTEDDTHRGHAKAGIRADPLKLRHSDVTLVKDADSVLAKQVRKTVRKAIADRFDRRRKRAEAAWSTGRQHEAATIWLSLWFGAPERLSRADQQRLSQYLGNQYKLRSPLVR